MPGIKGVKQPLQPLPLLPVIQGKGDKAEACRGIIAHRSRERQKSHAHPAPEQRMLLPEHVKQERGDDREDGIIRTQQQRQGGDPRDGEHAQYGFAGGYPLSFRTVPAPDPVEQHQRRGGEEKGQHDVLVPQPEPAVESQVKGDLADQREKAEAAQVFLFIPRMRKALGDEKRKDGHSEPADHPGPHDAGEKHVAHVIEYHADHGNDFQCGPVQYLNFFHAVHLRRLR